MFNFLISTPISDLIIKNFKYLDQVMHLSDCLELRDHTIDFSASSMEIKKKVFLYHSDVQLIHKLTFKEMTNLFMTVKKFPNLKYISFMLQVVLKIQN